MRVLIKIRKTFFTSVIVTCTLVVAGGIMPIVVIGFRVVVVVVGGIRPTVVIGPSVEGKIPGVLEPAKD